RVNGLRVLDDQGRQVLQLDSLTTGLSIVDVLRGNYDAGKVVVKGLDFNIKREADRTLNVARLAKAAPAGPAKPLQPAPSQPAPPQPAPPPGPPERAKPVRLPNVRADVQLVDCRGTFEDVPQRQTVQFTSIRGGLDIPDINQPIHNQLEV